MTSPRWTAWPFFFLMLAVFPLILRAEKKAEPAKSPEQLARERELQEKCLECHKDPKLQGGGRTGAFKSLFVDPEKYHGSIHSAEDFTCFTCHPGTPLGYHPREGVVIRSCGDCHDHETQAKEFGASVHGRSLALGDRNAADCQDCHGNHYIRKKDDSSFAMAAPNAAARCVRCHPDEAVCRDIGCAFGFDRLSGHGKQDLSQDNSVLWCTECHYGDQTHGNPETEPVCGSCHKAHFNGTVLGRVHPETKGGVGLFLILLRNSGLMLVLAISALIFLPVGWRAVAFFRHGTHGPKAENT
jgi:hypothetical protein